MLCFLRPYRAKSPLEKPLRGEILSKDLLESRAVELAQYHSHVQIGRRGARLRQRFRENTRVLNEAYFAFAEAAKNKEMLAAGAEWLLDNFHVIDEQVRDIRRDLPKSYYQALPKLTSGEWKGYPRVYQIICEFISHTDSIVETDALTTFISGYQTKTTLSIGEIWAVPIMLRLALVENLRRLSRTGLLVTEHRRAAELVCHQVLDERNSAGADMLIQLVNRVNANPSVLEYSAGHILRRLRAKGAPAALSLQWLDEQLRERGIDPNEVAHIEQQNQAADQVSVGNSVTALKTIGSLNWREWFEGVSAVDKILIDDPAAVYGASDFITRDVYRHRIERLARRSRKQEVEVCEAIVEFARRSGERRKREGDNDIRSSHVGYYLIDEGREEFEQSLQVKDHIHHRVLKFIRQNAVSLYLGSIALLTAVGIVLSLRYSIRHDGSGLWLLLSLLLFPIPLSEFSIHVIHWLVTKFVRPVPLPKMNYDEGIPASARTAVVIQTILGDSDSLDSVAEALEIRAIGNQDPNLVFGLLADFVDAPTESLSGDLGILRRAREVIDELNRKYCADSEKRFFVLFRKRVWNPSEKKYMGWERKRGKVMEFNRFLRGATDTTFQFIAGDPLQLRDIRYVITLDNDSRLPPGVARKLVSTLDHPLNQPVIDERSGIVTKGYGIIQPRVGITLQSANASRYAEVVSGHTGLDPYTMTVSDIYQDLFREGSYIGKGIYHVDAFERALDGRFPENRLLSHDLIEGAFARCGLASDIEVFDDFPQRYHAQARRQHRWIRGDWQLLPWIFGRIPAAGGQLRSTPLSALSRWKLIDNLRRSLVAPLLFFSLVAMWTIAPGSQAVWLAAFAVLISFPILIILWRVAFDLPIGYSFSTFLYSLYSDYTKNLQLIIFVLVFLPHQAVNALSAIGVTLYRVVISKKNLLEWETAAAAEQRLAGDLKHFVKAMLGISFLLLPGLLIVLFFGERGRYFVPILFFLTWAASPVLAWWVSQRRQTMTQSLTAEERSYLRNVAYSTWRYFDTFLVPEYNYLIPDNLQIVPQRVVAERTSPTNISLSILSVISAYDLGFISLPAVLNRLEKTFEALQKLERFHGHFLNWYGIRHLESLHPRYISTVDSGNLVGHFIAVRETLLRYPFAPLCGKAHVEHLCLRLREAVGADEQLKSLCDAVTDIDSLQDLVDLLVNIRHVSAAAQSRDCPEELCRTIEEFGELERLLAWTSSLEVLKKLGIRKLLPKKVENIDRILTGRVPTLSLLSKIVNRLLKIEQAIDIETLNDEESVQFSLLVSQLRDAQAALEAFDQLIQSLCRQISAFVYEADFRFLFDSQKKLFVIGYNIDNGQKDNSYYDLLASEARLASLVAIAKGDVPQSHWFLLNRALTESPGGKALISWSGTMFEYLMPILVTRNFPLTLLSETYSAVVKAQRIYGSRRGIPWGISESAYSGVDFEKTYQYRAFGIPGLGLKRGLAEDLVVSPYSTVMAVVIDPQNAIRNLQRLEADGVRGEYGFYEAVDYTPERLGVDENQHIVKSFLAHHQGMSLVSINNMLNNNIFQDRFHSDPAIKSCELLLQERFPTRIPVIYPHQAEVLSLKAVDSEGKTESMEVFKSAYTRYPYTRILSNRNYTLIVDNAGSGGSFFRSDISLTRFRDDGLNNNSGTFIYIRDLQGGPFWSAAYQPVKSEPEAYEAIFNLDKVEFKRRDQGISTLTEITVSPEDNVEVRRVTLTNLSGRMRELELTSFGEVALASVRADAAHPAFSKMFVSSEYLEDYDALIFVRKPRSEHDKEIYMMHLVTMSVVWAPTQYETARDRFLGRGGTLQAPAAMLSYRPLKGSTGTVLDPVFALRNKVEIDAGESQIVCYVTGIADTREEILQLVRKYREGQHISRAFEMAWSHSDVEIRHQQFSRSSVLDFQKLANALLYNIESLRAPAEVMKRSKLAQNALWRFGVSGDEPIVLLMLSDPDQMKLCEELLYAHEYLRLRGIRFDLIILNEYQSGYLQDLQHEIEFAIRTGASRNVMEQRGGVFLRSINQLSEEELALLQATARVIISGNRGPLSTQLGFVQKNASELVSRKIERSRPVRFTEPRLPAGEFDNGFGSFAEQGRSYQLSVSSQSLPPLPWVNVVANPAFGFLVSETGAGYTWADNSRENRLSSWSNDPVADPHTEVIYLRDQDTGDYWCPTPLPVRVGHPVHVVHGYGETRFSAEVNLIASSLELSGSEQDPVKWWHLELQNNDSRARKLEIFLYFEWVLGVTRSETYRSIRAGYDPDKEFLWATNPYNIDFSEQVLFLGSNHKLHSYTANRREFIGRLRDPSQPAAFEQVNLLNTLGQRLVGGRSSAVVLSGTTGAGFDSCAVLKVQLHLTAGEKHHVLFYAAKADNMEQAREMSSRYRSIGARNTALENVRKYWTGITNTVEVKTPDRKLDILVNGWLEYQTLSCRMYARSGFYQSSGAIGFRDQLQDSMAFLISRPDIARQQILLHASRQFPEGDVQHWWHPPSGRGIRTRISDNYLWLPYVVDEYLRISGDTSILDESVGFIEGPQLEPDKADSYFTPQISNRHASLYEHCLLALDHAQNTGPHGLPLMGCGDWNDGMNLVGIGGKGESVWLAWFLSDILRRFAPYVEARGEQSRAERYRSKSAELVRAIEERAWDGKWYRRAFFDDGSPLGSAANEECKIDAIAQSWAILTGLGQADRQHTAFESLWEHLVDQEHRLIKLLTPPFQQSRPNPGYIQSYPPGLRENGGQYTHGVVWAVFASVALGDGNRAFTLFDLINPISHALDSTGAKTYKTEPYVTCGDVYTSAQHLGRGGWSWYTGSSGWFYRAAVEGILGLKVEGASFRIEPCIPREWPEYSLQFRYREAVYRIQVKNPGAVSRGVREVHVNGQKLEDKTIECLPAGSEAEVVVVLG
jgi:cellobiose phosphorylase